jgi:hypothetical protein
MYVLHKCGSEWIMSVYQWQINAKYELDQAKAARRMNNEGKARVCARRAVGYIIKAYLSERYNNINSLSAYSSIQHFVDLPNLPKQTREVASHFLLRITVDHKLPLDVDLIADASWLAKELMDVDI